MLLTAITSLVFAVQSYAEKKTVSSGISRRDFFFFSCLSLLPFASLMIVLTPFYFQPSYWLIPILLVSVLLRYGKMTAIVSTVERLVPYESEAYMCLGVILAYMADCALGVKAFSAWGITSIAVTLLGVFLIADVKLQIKTFRVNLIIRILCDVGLGYCARYAMQYCSNATYIFALNALIVLLFCWKYLFHRGKRSDENRPNIKLVLIQQFLGFVCLFLANFVAQESVTLYAFIRPLCLALCVIIAFFLKKQPAQGSQFGEPRRPKIKDVLAISLIIAGICLQLVK